MPDNLPQAALPYKVMAVYKFADLPDAAAIQPVLTQFCCVRAIKGTLILAPEGINGTVAGTPEAIDALHAFLLEDPLWASRLDGAEIKFSGAAEMPFLRMKVRLKHEIVTLRAPEANPSQTVGTYVAPADWNSLIERDDVVLVDTRNDYEVGLGTFKGALDPATATFTEFKDYVATHLDPARDKKVAMFCTGGIRCEKASSYLLSQGFAEVFHLKGGILAYLETVPEPESRFEGECFVFDDRVAVGHGLAQGEATLCRACRHPLTPADRADPRFSEGVACPHCADDTAKHAAAAERQKQIELARQRGTAHLGDEAAEAARRAKQRKRDQAEQSRLRNNRG
ncbi:rhodanese-related sulfurtransferase [Devosia sp. 1635]|uniref:oxygen-dependent tRNA uridine(34) hydroxylase TrhO n=1 Tax=Devosia sp. 1635 TaxID=2726066 RepID=UPI0015673DBF|nr:rhodanese-related sulfurtransferase [Devosia sp. 1635]